MEIGREIRTYTIEPIQTPIPEMPHPDAPVRAPEEPSPLPC
jgi:hypothetical protein